MEQRELSERGGFRSRERRRWELLLYSPCPLPLR